MAQEDLEEQRSAYFLGGLETVRNFTPEPFLQAVCSFSSADFKQCLCSILGKNECVIVC